MDYDKKVISQPTSDNCNFIEKSSSSVVLNSFFNKKGSSGISFLPITFSGLSYVDNLAREKNNDSVVASGFFKSASFTLLKTLITLVAVAIFVALVVLDQKTIQHIDLFPFSNKYNDYMRLYCFLAANHDVISEELMGKYADKLESILDSFSKEADMIVDLAGKYEKDIEKAQLEKKQLEQKMADEDALRVVPVEENDF